MKKSRIIKIIDDYKVVVNIGSNKGVTNNYKFLIYELGDELFDPDTEESLGRLEIIKGTGTPVHIQDKITTIETDEYTTPQNKKTIKKSGGGIGIIFSSPVEEEIIEAGEKEMVPFDNPKEGDFIKIIVK